MTDLTVSAYLTDPGQIIFNPGASAFTITILPLASLDPVAQGIINNSGVEQNFVIPSDEDGNTGSMAFIEEAAVGDLVTFTMNPRPQLGGFAFSVGFQADSSAGGGKFINQGGIISGSLGGVDLLL